MPDPAGYSWVTYCWVGSLSVLGGIVSHLNKLRNGTPFTMLRFGADILTAAFVGVVTFYLCEWAKLDQTLSAALVAISGHMGSRTIFIFEQWARGKLEAMTKL